MPFPLAPLVSLRRLNGEEAAVNSRSHVAAPQVLHPFPELSYEAARPVSASNRTTKSKQSQGVQLQGPPPLRERREEPRTPWRRESGPAGLTPSSCAAITPSTPRSPRPCARRRHREPPPSPVQEP